MEKVHISKGVTCRACSPLLHQNVAFLLDDMLLQQAQVIACII